MMDEKFLNLKCTAHPNDDFVFYCFDEKTFLCENCFKPHKKHNFELKKDLVDSDNAYKFLKSIKGPLSSIFKQIKEELLKVKEIIEKELSKIDEYLNEGEKFELIREKKDIFDLSYKEYEKMNVIWNSYNIFNRIAEKISNIKKLSIFRVIEPKNFRFINNTIKVDACSSVHPNFPVDIMLGRFPGDYTLFNGNKNHYIIFDLLSDQFINNLRFKGRKDFNCTPKNFQISVKKTGENWGTKKSFVGKEFWEDYQFFDICEEGRYVRIDFNDTWGTTGGNYILITELAFNVADLMGSNI